MRVIVVYVSKTGNTRELAAAMADQLHSLALPLNLFGKQGRGSKEDREQEKELFQQALAAANQADAVILGTPAGFHKAHSKVLRFARQFEANAAGIFCTHAQDLGSTLSDVEEIFRTRNLLQLGSQTFYPMKPGGFMELEPQVRRDFIHQAEIFAERCRQNLTRMALD